jgi:hypothetical protein
METRCFGTTILDNDIHSLFKRNLYIQLLLIDINDTEHNNTVIKNRCIVFMIYLEKYEKSNFFSIETVFLITIEHDYEM